MNAFEKLANASETLLLYQWQRPSIKLAEVGPGAEATLLIAGNDTSGTFVRECGKSRDKLLKVVKHCRANFIGRRMVERQLDDSFTPFPAQRLAEETLHACCLLTPRTSAPVSVSSRSRFPSYRWRISVAYRSWIASRRSLPLAVNNPASTVNASDRTL